MPQPHFSAGDLRFTITIQQPQAVLGATGTEVSWVAFFTTNYAAVQPLRGTDAWRNGQFTSEKFTKVAIRYRPGVLADMRVLFKGRTFVIQDVVNPEERSVYLELLCVELDGQ